MIRILLISGIALLIYSQSAATAATTDGRSSSAASSLPRLDCVGCDACNGAGGNHITLANGGRDGVVHECFAGQQCSTAVHPFKTSCGGEEVDDALSSDALSWDSLSMLEGEELVEFLRSSGGRWSLDEDSSTMQWADCYGTLIASMPMSATQLETTRLVVEELAQIN